MKKKINIAMLGKGFMGRAHSNGWLKVAKFFDVPYEPVLKVVFGRDKEDTEVFAETWGYDETSSDWHEIIKRDDIDIVDIVAPTLLHKDMVVEAAKAGKAIFCEKPAAINYKQAVEMAEAVRKAGVLNYLNHNYRRIPAITYARQLIDEGKLGRIYHWRGAYLQDWIMDPDFPLTWHLKKEYAAGGPLWDLSSHSIDLARYLVGEIKSVMAMQKTFIQERPLPGKGASTFTAGKQHAAEMGKVEVDDASFIIAEFENGAMGSIDSSRFAGGRKNYNYFEIYGSKGSLLFDLERLNELLYLDLEQPTTEQGYRNIIVTSPAHPYAGAWWGPGHMLGYEHTFVHVMSDYLNAMKNGAKMEPNLEDGVRIIQVLDAAVKSNEEERKIYTADIK